MVPGRRWSTWVVAAIVATLVVVSGDVTSGAKGVALTGTVQVAGTPMEGFDVELRATDPGGGPPTTVATDATEADGSFGFDVVAPDGPDSILYLLAVPGAGATVPERVTLASVLGPMAPSTVVVSELTTVATAYAMAQHTTGHEIAGPLPGVPNAAMMAPNLADPTTGGISDVLASAPNGAETEAIRSFRSLGNMIAACASAEALCDALQTLATSPEGGVPTGTFEAIGNIARDPWQSPTELWDQVASQGPTPHQPARVGAPDAWTLVVRFWGDGESLNGPGNFAVDHEGNVWVANNYEFAPLGSGTDVCDGTTVMKLDPSGRYVPGSPFPGGGLSGVGYGIVRDPFGAIWLSNFGFASPGCADQPPHNSISVFAEDGTPLSPDGTGFTQGDVSWPQGMAANAQGDIWTANCGNDSVTIYPEGDPTRAMNVGLGTDRPFDVAFGADGSAYVTSMRNSEVVRANPDGTPNGPPLTGAFSRPMGIVADSQGNLWVANSGLVDLPCPSVEKPTDNVDPSVALIRADGTVDPGAPFHHGGLSLPWGIAVDGDDNVWVSNFAERRISQVCGVPATDCRPGQSAGDGISADDSGYSFDGLRRSTAVAVDQAGNVWATNNWKEVPLQNNPGGYEVVVYVGIAEPVEVAAPRERPEPGPTPSPTPTPAPAPVAPTAQAVAVPARFTG